MANPTAVSNLFDPEICLMYGRQEFTKGLAFIKNCFGRGPEFPVVVEDEAVFGKGGQFVQRPTFADPGNPFSRRDLTSQGTTTSFATIVGVNEQEVLLNFKCGPYTYNTDAEWISRARPGALSKEFGIWAGQYMPYVLQNVAISALVGAVSAMSGVAHTTNVYQAARANAVYWTPQLLQQALGCMGDFMDRLKTIVWPSQVFADASVDAFGRAFQGIGDLALKGQPLPTTIGRSYSTVDDPNLLVAGAPNLDQYFALILGAEAARMRLVRFVFYPEIALPLNELRTIEVRGDLDIAIGIKGFSYNSGVGGANPSVASLATSAVWTPTYTSAKQVNAALVELNTRAS